MKEELEIIVEILNKSTMSKVESYAVNVALGKIVRALEDSEKPTENEIKKKEA